MTTVVDRPARTFVVEAQALIAKALYSFLNRNRVIQMVGDAPLVRLEDLERTQPDLIVYGLDNAVQDICEAVALARSVLPAVRFCVLSNFANPDVLERSLASGANGFVVKDVSSAEFDVALRVLVSGSTYVDPRIAAGGTSRRDTRGAPHAALAELTDREGEILRLIVMGCSNKEISEKLGLAAKTVKNYNNRIYNKLDVGSRTQAAVFAVKAGFARAN